MSEEPEPHTWEEWVRKNPNRVRGHLVDLNRPFMDRPKDPKATPVKMTTSSSFLTVRVVVPLLAPSLNTLLRRWRDVRWRTQQKRAWRNAVLAARGSNRSFFERCTIEIERCYARHPIADTDNLYGSFKFILDALKGLYFPDDNSTCVVAIFPTQTKVAHVHEEQTIITLRQYE